VNESGGDERQIPIQRVPSLKGVVRLDGYDATRAVMLFDLRDRLDLRVVTLP